MVKKHGRGGSVLYLPVSRTKCLFRFTHLQKHITWLTTWFKALYSSTAYALIVAHKLVEGKGK